MKLSHIFKEHIEDASKVILKKNIPSNQLKGIYKVIVNNREYPFKYLIRIAHNLTPGNEQEWLDFTSQKRYRDYIEGLGFKIVAYNDKVPFFTDSDVLDISNNSLKTYNPNNTEHKQLANRIKKNSWGKTKYWLNLLESELEGYQFKINMAWGQRGRENGNRVSAFKPYTWAKIYKEGDEAKHIYFTIGIDGGTQTLLFKLDYKQVGKSLTIQQKSICEKLVRSIATRKISLSDLHLSSWDLLIEQTVDFINEHSDFYTKIVDEVWNTNQKRIARLAFNTNGWVFPSGPYGKSTHLDSHEARHGYGHEEWLFDIGKIVDGYHYGFLEPIRKQQGAYQDNKYDVWLYTIDGVTGRRFWIGEILNVEVLDNVHASQIMLTYQANGWHNEMENQIKSSGGNEVGFSHWNGVDLFNVRFKPSDINLNEVYVELPAGHPLYNQSRYSFAHYKDEFNIEDSADVEDFNFQFGVSNSDSNGKGKVKSSVHTREPRTVEITYLHKAISDKLTQKLIERYGKTNVRAEHPAGYNSNRIDIVVKSEQGLIFYEIKTYPTLKNSIREAIGQLLEYGLWTNQNRAKELIIVTQPHKNFEKAKAYLNHLRSLFKIPIYYQSFDLENDQLSEKV